MSADYEYSKSSASALLDEIEENATQATSCCDAHSTSPHQRLSPRPTEETQKLKNRLNRMIGQLNGIGRMIEEDRYCGDILTQIAAVQSALSSFGHLVLKSHMQACVSEQIKAGNTDVVDETVELIRKLR